MGIHFGTLVLGSLALLPSSTAAQGMVWVVDDTPGPGVDFTSIQAAVNAASDGDVLLLKQGVYSSFTINGRSLTLQADDGATPYVAISTDLEEVVIKNSSASQSVRIRGLDIYKTSIGAVLELADNAGPVWIENCDVWRNQESSPTDGGDALFIHSCDSVVLIDVLGVGGDFDDPGGIYSNPSSGNGLRVAFSDVHAFRCTFLGGNGGTYYPSFFLCPSPGGSGISQLGGFLFLSECEATGGAGACGSILCSFPGNCANGGPGLSVFEYLGVGSAVAMESTLQGGPAPVGCGGCLMGPPVYVIGAGSFQSPQDAAVSLLAASPRREGESIDLLFTGPPRVQVWLGTSTNPRSTFLPFFSAPLLLLPPVTISYCGVTNGNGVLRKSMTLAPLPPGVESQICFFQSLYLDLNAPRPPATTNPAFIATKPNWVLGSGTMVVELDDSF